MTVIIKKKNEDKVLKFANDAISCLDSDSKSVSNYNIIPFQRYIYVLSNLIDIDDFEDNKSLIKEVLMSNRSLLDVEHFKTKIEDKRNEIQNKKKVIFYFIYPLKIKYGSIEKAHFILRDIKIKICSYDEVMQKFPFDEIRKLPKYMHEKIEANLKPSSSFFIIEMNEINVNRGMSSATDTIELFRSIINFSYHKEIIYSPVGEPSLAPLIYPPEVFFAFDSDKKYIKQWGTYNAPQSHEIDFNSDWRTKGTIETKSTIESAVELIDKINSIHRSTFKDLIIATFQLYNYGLDNFYKPSLSMLTFWQILEVISKAGTRRTNTILSKRICFLFGKKDPYADMIQIFIDKRNEFAHSGISGNITANDLEMIIQIVHGMMMFLIDNEKQFKNIKDLDFFYNAMGILNTDIETKTDILNFIKKING